MERVYRALASAAEQHRNCLKSGNTEWKVKTEARIDAIVKNHLPSGAGIDAGTKFDVEASSSDKLVFYTSFHHMDENGSYDGWTEHTIRVYPSLTQEIRLTVSGVNRKDIKDYLAEAFHFALTAEIDAYAASLTGAADIPADFPVQPLQAGQTAKDRATCGTCGRSWDDGKSTSMTPTPAGRCPFEAFHNGGAL